MSNADQNGSNHLIIRRTVLVLFVQIELWLRDAQERHFFFEMGTATMVQAMDLRIKKY